MCLAISTQMPTSTVHTWAKTTISHAKLQRITCELFSRLSVHVHVSQLERDLAASVNPSITVALVKLLKLLIDIFNCH